MIFQALLGLGVLGLGVIWIPLNIIMSRCLQVMDINTIISVMQSVGQKI